MIEYQTINLDELRWRVGSKVGRTIYAVVGDHFDDVLIGVMDTRALAELVVDDHNQHIPS